MNQDLTTLQPDRPNIITTEIEAISFYRDMNIEEIVSLMISGKYVLVEAYYSDGLDLLAQLKKNLLRTHKDKSFQGQREYRSAFREASHRLLVEVKKNRLLAKKSPDIGWLKVLYPEVSDF